MWCVFQADDGIRDGEVTGVQTCALPISDRSHGLKMSLYPDGADQSGPPGLKIDPPQVNWKIEKDEERIIEFVAERAGTYGFKCSIFCGLGHGGMRGKLVVDE